jgi:hypothetical protein
MPTWHDGAVSVPHDPYYSPTTRLPVVKPQSSRLKILAGVTAVTALVVTVAVWAISSGSGDESPAVPIAAPSVVVTEDAPVEDEPSVAPTSKSPSPSPSPSRTTRPAATRPGELVNQLQNVVRSLAQREELDRRGATELNRRLEQLQNRLRRDPDKASRKLDEFVKKLADLREDDRISEAGFEALAAGATQIGAVLPGSGSDDDDDDDDD